jgi:hypothetical protein
VVFWFVSWAVSKAPPRTPISPRNYAKTPEIRSLR